MYKYYKRKKKILEQENTFKMHILLDTFLVSIFLSNGHNWVKCQNNKLWPKILHNIFCRFLKFDYFSSIFNSITRETNILL